jgi:hypothetical protein
VLDPDSHRQLGQAIAERIEADHGLLEQLRSEIRPLRSAVRRIQPRTTTAVSLVGTDGGNNKVEFDPFLIQIIRVVDSNNEELCLEAISPTTNVALLSRQQFDASGEPSTALGYMMAYLGVTDLTRLSPMIPKSEPDKPVSPTWVQVYRQLVEWAILFSLIRMRHWGSDILLIFDGFLRSKVFQGELFSKFVTGLQEGVAEQYSRRRRRLYLAGLAKHSKVLDRYRLAMMLEQVLATDYPAYVEVPREIEEKAYVWSEYARGNDREIEGEANKFVGGKMFFVKFGSRPRDPIWPIDIFEPQASDAGVILGYMLGDALNGFPVPFYPRCLQKAHEHAALVDFDFAVIQDQIFAGIRGILDQDAPMLDVFRLQDLDPAQRRYG